VSNCYKCGNDDIYRRPFAKKRENTLVWVCGDCMRSDTVTIVRREIRALPVIFRTIVPLMGVIFALVMLGIHLS